jgi:hypothetical protein
MLPMRSDMQGLLQIVGHADGRGREFPLGGPDEEGRLHLQVAVEVGEGLVQEQERRFHDHGPGQGHALLLAARELGGVGLCAVLQVEVAEHVRDAPAGIGAGQASGAQAEGHVLEHGHAREQDVVLEDEDCRRLAGDGSVRGHGAAVGPIQPGDDVQ